MVITTSTDFTLNALADLGQTVTLTSRTRTTTEAGDEVFAEATTTPTIFIHIGNSENLQQKYGLHREAAGYIMFSTAVSINRNDFITYNNLKYIVKNQPLLRGAGADSNMYKYADIYLYLDNGE